MNNRILVLSNHIGGLYSFRKELMAELCDSGYEVSIATPMNTGYELKTKYFKDLGCKLIDTPFKRKGINPLADLKQIRTYIKLIKSIKPLVVLSYTIKPNLYGGMACTICRVPQLANVTGLGSAVENPGWLQKLTICLYKIGLRKTHKVFFQNEANRQFCLTHKMVINGQDILIPGSGVNLTWHTLQPYPEDGMTKFIYIGRVMKEKGIDQFLDAAKYIKKKYPNTEFHILGECEESYQDLLSSLREKDIIVYHGEQSDVRPFISAVNCTIHASYYPEGMSNVLLESCAAGRSVITTNRPGCGEIVEDGITGYIVEPRNSSDVIAKIEDFLALTYEQKKAMGERARIKVEREFDRQIVIRKYMTIINKIKEENNE